MAKAKEIFVHVDLKGKTHLIGRLWIHASGQGESASFEYSRGWRQSSVGFSLEPALKLGEGSFHTPRGKSLFGSIGDSAPDRWGRVLMKRLEARSAREEKRARRLLQDSDYLLMVNDRARQGALRFSEEEKGQEFGLTLKDARVIAKEVATATQTWDKDAAHLGVASDEIELMRSAFDHDDLKLGLKG